jgi:hypothetical protein
MLQCSNSNSYTHLPALPRIAANPTLHAGSYTQSRKWQQAGGAHMIGLSSGSA